ncbi:MAG TPA: hypothetical protein DCL53_11845 [Thauera sp.]|nr:hypothetical protein [Thauera sp.]
MNLRNVKSSVVAGLVVTTITSTQALILAPALIAAVGVSAYGAWIVAADVFMVLQLFDFGLTAYSAQRIAAANSEGKTQLSASHFFATITIVSALVLVLLATSFTVLSLISNPATLSANEASALKNCIAIGIIAVAIQLISYSFIAPARALQDLSLVNIFAVVAAAGGLILTIALLFLDFGLYAAAAGLLLRSLINLIGGILSWHRLRLTLNARIITRKSYLTALRDQVSNAPSTFIGNFSVLALNTCDNIIIGIASGPNAVALYSITKKLFDFCRTISDILAYSAYGGLSATVAKLKERDRNLSLLKYIAIAFLFSIALAIPAISANELFVTLWVGFSHYGGTNLVLFIASATILSSTSNFTFTALRSEGSFKTATLAVFIEFLAKALLGATLVSIIGAPGMPIAATVGALIAVAIALHKFSTKNIPATFLPLVPLLHLCLASAILAVTSAFVVKTLWLNALIFLTCSFISLVIIRKLESHART